MRCIRAEYDCPLHKCEAALGISGGYKPEAEPYNMPPAVNMHPRCGSAICDVFWTNHRTVRAAAQGRKGEEI